MGETEFANDGSVTGRVRVAVWHRVAGRPGAWIGVWIVVWEGKCLDDLNIANITMNEVGAVENEEMGLGKVDLDEMG